MFAALAPAAAIVVVGAPATLLELTEPDLGLGLTPVTLLLLLEAKSTRPSWKGKAREETEGLNNGRQHVTGAVGRVTKIVAS